MVMDVESEKIDTFTGRIYFLLDSVGDESFIQNIQQELSGRISGRSIVSEYEMTSLQEPQSPYSTFFFAGQKSILNNQNRQIEFFLERQRGLIFFHVVL